MLFVTYRKLQSPLICNLCRTVYCETAKASMRDVIMNTTYQETNRQQGTGSLIWLHPQQSVIHI
jgi:hypothetical protein